MKPIYWAIIIFICAATFRLTAMDLMEFKLDEARDVYEMSRFYKEPYLFQKGPIQSTGVYNPPLWYYILAVIALPSRNPLYLSFIIALLNCLAVAGFYLVVNRFYGMKVGVVAGLLLAFSPWSILLSRKIWSPDILLPFLVPLFYFIHRLIIDKKPKSIFWVALLLSFIAQLHASGIFLMATTIGVMLISRVNISWKYALLGLFISLIPFLPYLTYQISTGCEDCRNIFNYQSESKQTDINVFLRPFQFIGGSSFDLVLGEDYSLFTDHFPAVNFFNIVFLLEFILGILGVIYFLKHKTYTAVHKLYLLGVAAVVPLLYLITQTPAHLYYFIILSPIMIVVYALGIASLRRAFSITIVTIIIIINIIFEASFYSFLSQKQNIQGDFGPIYRLTKQEAEEKLIKYKDSKDYELVKSEYYVNLFNNQITP